MKTEKRLKKIAEEKKKEAMASGDTPLSMNKAFQQRQEKTGQAHFVLSVGNRGAVPQAAEFFDAQPLAKGKTEKVKKKKGGQECTEDRGYGLHDCSCPNCSFDQWSRAKPFSVCFSCPQSRFLAHLVFIR